jgi:hypothetical protein
MDCVSVEAELAAARTREAVLTQRAIADRARIEQLRIELDNLRSLHEKSLKRDPPEVKVRPNYA